VNNEFNNVVLPKETGPMIPKRIRPPKILNHLIVFCFAVGIVSHPILAQEDEVWEMEEAYWRYVQAGDVESYTDLWHSDFVGWPCGLEQPTGKANVGGMVRAVRDQEYTVIVDLHREAVQQFGEIAIVHYSAAATRRYANGGNRTSLYKLTHTWKRMEGQWQIIGGMCGPLQPDTRAADEAAIRDADIAWSKAFEMHDLEAIVSYYADDVIVLPPNMPAVVGKQAARELNRSQLAMPGRSGKWQPEQVEVARSGDIGYSWGNYVLTMTGPSGSPVTDRGKYVAIWKKQADGRWNVAVEAFNSDLPPTPL
jgi:ketosteroid isomerase-like protein